MNANIVIEDLVKTGQIELEHILEELNRYSAFLRTKDEFRREVDFQELCITLALYRNYQIAQVTNGLIAIAERLDGDEDGWEFGQSACSFDA